MNWEFLANKKSSKIVKTISLWYLAIVFTLFIIGIIAIPSIVRLDGIARDIYIHPFSVSNSAIELRYNIIRIRNLMFQSFFATNKEEILKLSEEIDLVEITARENISVIKRNFLGDKEKVMEMERLFDKWKDVRKLEFQFLVSGQRVSAEKLRNEVEEEIFHPMNLLILYVIDFAKNKVASFVLESEETMKRVILSLLLLIFMVLGSGFFIMKRVIRLQTQTEKEATAEREEYLIESRLFAEQELVKNKNQLKLIADNVPASVSMVNVNLEFQFINKRFAEIHRVSFEECLGKTVADIMGQSVYDKVHMNYTRALLGEAVTYENLFDLKDGTSRYFEIKYTPFYEDERQTGVVILSHDITERKMSEVNLVKAKEEAEIANRLKSEFLANMSHEIRTPMNAILGFSEILKDKVGTDPVVLDYLSGIQKSGKNLISLINDILDLAKIEAGKLDIVYSPVNLFSVIQDVRQIFSLQTMQKRLNFEIAIDEKLPKSLLIDELRLRQVLFNLIGNAVKFTEKGEIKVKVIYIPKGGDSSSIDLVIEIHDTGIGIPEQEIDSIFEPFIQQSGQDVMRFGGSGLGLSITKKLVEMMGGTISVTSKLGVGSIFRIYIQELEISSLAHNGKEHDLEISNIKFDPARILLVEDIESNRKVVTGFLERFHFTIMEAQNGRIALELLATNSFDLILMDMQMPELDGKSTSLLLKRHPKYKDIPILILTASAMKENVQEILTFADGYLCKPISKLELINEIALFLPHQRKLSNQNRVEFTEKNFLVSMKDFLLANPIEVEFKKDLDQWFADSDSARKSLQTNKLTVFIESLKRLGEKFNVDPLIQFSDNLLRLIKNFSIPEISEALRLLEPMHVIVTKETKGK
ncbi:MAG TPA: ATP-binding protein [Leptospiraceae bacterium]|nr:ATP-binding protein [Leptospiraceae bacterium]